MPIAENHRKLVGFVLDKAEAEPISKRIELYTSLAEIIGDEQEAANLRELVQTLRNAEALCQVFSFEFHHPGLSAKRKNNDGNGKDGKRK